MENRHQILDQHSVLCRVESWEGGGTLAGGVQTDGVSLGRGLCGTGG